MDRNLIYTLRKERGLTLNQLALQVGVQAPTLSKWERGAIMPSREKIDTLATIFGVEYEILAEVAPRCAAFECPNRATNEGFCKKHYNNNRTQNVRPIITDDMAKAASMGERLNLLRTSKKLTLEQLAQNFGVTCSTIEAWECNWIKPSLHMLLDIAAYFFVTTRFLERGVVDE